MPRILHQCVVSSLWSINFVSCNSIQLLRSHSSIIVHFIQSVQVCSSIISFVFRTLNCQSISLTAVNFIHGSSNDVLLMEICLIISHSLFRIHIIHGTSSIEVMFSFPKKFLDSGQFHLVHFKLFKQKKFIINSTFDSPIWGPPKCNFPLPAGAGRFHETSFWHGILLASCK